jgi:hypothetical protein
MSKSDVFVTCVQLVFAVDNDGEDLPGRLG